MLVGLRSRKHITPFELVRPASVEQACRACSEPGRSRGDGGRARPDRPAENRRAGRSDHSSGRRPRAFRNSARRRYRLDRRTDDARRAGAQRGVGRCGSRTCRRSGVPSPIRAFDHAGTLGGNLMSAMPHYDALPALLALGAQALVFDRAAAHSDVGFARASRPQRPSFWGRFAFGVRRSTAAAWPIVRCILSCRSISAQASTTARFIPRASRSAALTHRPPWSSLPLAGVRGRNARIRCRRSSRARQRPRCRSRSTTAWRALRIVAG